MSGILNVQGKPYTTAEQDIRLEQLKTEFREELGAQMLDAMRKTRDGRLQLDMRGLNEFIEQAYYMGREDAGG